MRLMIMHKNDPNTEAGHPPPMELVHQMGAFIGEYAKAGRFIDGAGLAGSRTRARVTVRHGHCAIEHGPYRGDHELPAAMLLLKVADHEQALDWATRYGRALGDADLEVGFAIMELDDMDEAIALSRRYAAILGGTLEIDVRTVDA